MNNIINFFTELNIWEWMALILFCLLPLILLNTLFSLKSRFNDWKALKDQTYFKNQLARLEELFSDAKQFNVSRMDFHEILFFKFLWSFVLFLFSLVFFIASHFNSRISDILILASLFNLLYSIFEAIRLIQYFVSVRSAFFAALQVLFFIKKAKKDNFLDEDFEEIENRIIEDDFFDDKDRRHLIKIMMDSYQERRFGYFSNFHKIPKNK